MQRTILVDVPQEVKDFLELEDGIYKNIAKRKLDQTHGSFWIVDYCYDEENNIEYYGEKQCQVVTYRNKHVIKAKSKNGFTYKDGKIRVWFGRKINELLMLNKLFEFKNWNFIENGFQQYLTKTAIEQLFKTNITSSRDIVRHYLKSIRIKASIDIAYKAIKTSKILKKELYYYCTIAKNPDHYFEFCIKQKEINNKIDELRNGIISAEKEKGNKTPGFNIKDNPEIKKLKEDIVDYNILRDTVNQFYLLEKEFDFKWSKKRIFEEHTKATRKIMDIEYKNTDNETIEYRDIELPYGFTVLNTKEQIYFEGKNMDHCVYTNYWDYCKAGNYIVFHISLNGEEATLGCNLHHCYYGGKKMEFSQMYGHRNNYVSTDLTEYVKNWVEENEYVFTDNPPTEEEHKKELEKRRENNYKASIQPF